jgi:uncharacterized membrane protein (UPF0127 family)
MLNSFIKCSHLLAQLISLSMIAATCYGAPLPSITLKIHQEIIKAEVASTPASQQMGLMYRKELPENQGMLFVFNDKLSHCFWMKNTEIPLAIAFIDASGKIINIAEMEALSESSHCPFRANPYALEMNRGWFTKRKLGPGSFVEGLPRP